MPYFKHAGLYLQNGKDNCYAIARRGWGAVVAFLNYICSSFNIHPRRGRNIVEYLFRVRSTATTKELSHRVHNTPILLSILFKFIQNAREFMSGVNIPAPYGLAEPP